MTAYEGLAIVPQSSDTPVIPGITMVSADGMTVLMTSAPRPAIRLPQTRKQALHTAAERQRRLEAAMPYGPVLPFRPETPLHPGKVPSLVQANAPLLASLIARLTGQVQFQITVRWDPGKVLDRFRSAPELTTIFAAGRTDAQTLQRALTALASRLSDDMTAELEAIAVDLIRLPRDTDMILNAVIMLPEAALPALDAAVAQIDAIWTEGLHIRQIGPAPAASFALLEVAEISRADLAQARTMLGLHGTPNPAQITTARKEALTLAPDTAQTIRHAAEVMMAHNRVRHAPFALCQVRTDAQSQAGSTTRIVA